MIAEAQGLVSPLLQSFYQDWSEDYQRWEDVVVDYLKKISKKERKYLALEIDALLNSELDEGELQKILDRAFCNYDVARFEASIAGWFRQLRALVHPYLVSEK